jgi:hypothetical protein
MGFATENAGENRTSVSCCEHIGLFCTNVCVGQGCLQMDVMFESSVFLTCIEVLCQLQFIDGHI